MQGLYDERFFWLVCYKFFVTGYRLVLFKEGYEAQQFEELKRNKNWHECFDLGISNTAISYYRFSIFIFYCNWGRHNKVSCGIELDG